MIEGLLGGMDMDQMMQMLINSGMADKFKGKMREMLDGIATEHKTSIDKVGIMLKLGKNEKNEQDVMLYFYANGKAVEKFSLEGFIAEGKRMGLV